MVRAIHSRIVCLRVWLVSCHANAKSGALQFVGNLFEYFLVRKNQGKVGRGKLLQATREIS